MSNDNEEFLIESNEEMKSTTEDNEDVEEIETLDEMDLDALIIEGKDAIIKESIEFFDIKSQKIKRMPIYLKPLSHNEWESSAREVTKKSKKSIEQLIVAKSLVDGEDMEVPLSKIKKMQKGVVSAIYEKVKKVSGQTSDAFQEAMLEKMSPF